MKSIKFRILIEGKFVYWGFIEKKGKMTFISPPSPVAKKMTIDDIKNLSRQFTHAYDHEGSALYEGAIIREKPNDTIGLVQKGEHGNFFVEWDNNDYPDWSWTELFYDQTHRILIIGDIDRNPELWKKNK